MKFNVNKTLLLLSDIDGVLTHSEILDLLEITDKAIIEIEELVDNLIEHEEALNEEDEDTTDISEQIRLFEIQLLYLYENKKTTLDALSLYEDEFFRWIRLRTFDIEICIN